MYQLLHKNLKMSNQSMRGLTRQYFKFEELNVLEAVIHKWPIVEGMH